MKFTFLAWVVVQMIFIFGWMADIIVLKWYLLLAPTWLYLLHFPVVFLYYYVRCWFIVNKGWFTVEFDKDERLY